MVIAEHRCGTEPKDFLIYFSEEEQLWYFDTNDTKDYKIRYCPFCGRHL